MSVCVKKDGQLVKSAGLYSVTKPIGMADIYSTEEKEVGLWVDNKPLYQKSFYVDSLPSSAGVKTVATGLTNIDMCKITGGWSNGFGELNIVRCESASAYSYGVGCWVAVTNGVPTINIEVGRNRSSIDAWVTLQYTKTTDTPWSGKFVPQGYGYVSSGDIYSLEERQIGVYVDGKPLYQKTVDFGSLPNNTTKQVAHNVANIETVVNIKGVMNYPNLVFGENLQPVTVNKSFRTTVRETVIEISTSDNWSSYGAIVTFQYTKTTDVAGSGEYVPSGDRAKHYDDTEQVIGTFFGETLYQKTIVQNNIAVGYDATVHTEIPHGVANFGKLVSLQMACPVLGYVQNEIMTSAAGAVIAVFRVDSTKIYASGGNNHFGEAADRIWYFTIQYTKTS